MASAALESWRDAVIGLVYGTVFSFPFFVNAYQASGYEKRETKNQQRRVSRHAHQSASVTSPPIP
jgi:hypothetical protein